MSQGLQFKGYGVLMEERPSYTVFEEEKPCFSDEFTIKFKLSLHNITAFGYIFLLQDTKTETAFNLTYAYKDEKNSLLKLNVEGKGNILTMELDNEMLLSRTWVDVVITFSLRNASISATVNKSNYTASNLNLPDDFCPNLVFGKNENSVDIASFSIRELSVRDSKQEYQFPLVESEGEDVHNNKGKVIGHAKNPVWLINRAFYWKRLFKYESQEVSGVNFQESSQKILFFNKDSITSFDLRTGYSSAKRYSNHLPVEMHLGTNFIDSNNNKLYVYEAHTFWNENCSFASLDLNKYEWENISAKSLPIQLHHHSGFFDPENNKYTIFGGFGNQRYNKEFITFDIPANRWDTLTFGGDIIKPRFFQSMTYRKDKNQLLVFGGMGNESGDQTVGRRNFYDLHEVDLNKKTISKLWDIHWNKSNIVPVRNMIMLDDSCLYTLCYPEYEANSHLQLYRFSTKDNAYEVLGDSIFFRSDKITTNANLYYNHMLSEFYCIVQVFEDDGSSVTELYSLAAPVVNEASLKVYSAARANKIPKLHIAIALVCGILVSLLSIVIYRKKKSKKEILPLTSEDIDYIGMSKDKHNAIYLFGQFTVYDKNGRDITYMFSTRLKHTFLIVLEHSMKGGISSQQLSETLWPDKDEYSVKNLRGVTLNQLRKIISELNGIELIFDKGVFKIVKTKECYCDCIHLLDLININTTDNTFDNIEKIRDILTRGTFLKSIDNNLLDSFKAYINPQLTSALSVYMEEVYRFDNFPLTIQLAEFILSINPLDEEAIVWQLKSLYRLKQINETKKVYILFANEYKKANNREYTTSLDSILNDKKG